MNKEQEACILNITAQYVNEAEAGRKPCLSDYLARYPHYAYAIADFVAYYHAIEEPMAGADMVVTTDEMAVKNAINRASTLQAINCHSDRYNESSTELASQRAITTLLTTAAGQRILPSKLAIKLNLSIDIILLLEQRAIDPETIPSMLYEQIATILQQSRTAVQGYFSAIEQYQPRSATQKRKPPIKVAEEHSDYSVSSIVDQRSFRSIVETSLQLSAEQRSHWDTILVTEGL